jgi:hypothetical protein
MAKGKRRQPEHTKIEDAISTAFGIFTELSEEMRDWYDNMPESFQNADKGSTVDESASTLENLSEPSIDDEIRKVLETLSDTTSLPLKRRASRADRRDYAVGLLSNSKQTIEDFLGEQDDAYDHRDNLDTLVNDLDEAISEADNVEFPGMYG